MKLYNNDWQIVHHVNLTTLQGEFNVLKHTVTQLELICRNRDEKYNFNATHANKFKSHQLTRECGSTLGQIQSMLLSIEDFNVDWFQTDSSDRPKRASLNIIGSIVRSLIGTLAQEDAEIYLARFQKLEKQGIHRDVLIDQQITLLK